MGRVEFEVTIDRARQIAHVLGDTIALDETNVVLVDRIDHVGGPPTVAGTMWIPVDLPSLEFDAAAFVSGDLRLASFAR